MNIWGKRDFFSFGSVNPMNPTFTTVTAQTVTATIGFIGGAASFSGAVSGGTADFVDVFASGLVNTPLVQTPLLDFAGGDMAINVTDGSLTITPSSSFVVHAGAAIDLRAEHKMNCHSREEIVLDSLGAVSTLTAPGSTITNNARALGIVLGTAAAINIHPPVSGPYTITPLFSYIPGSISFQTMFKFKLNGTVTTAASSAFFRFVLMGGTASADEIGEVDTPLLGPPTAYAFDIDFTVFAQTLGASGSLLCMATFRWHNQSLGTGGPMLGSITYNAYNIDTTVQNDLSWVLFSVGDPSMLVTLGPWRLEGYFC